MITSEDDAISWMQLLLLLSLLARSSRSRSLINEHREPAQDGEAAPPSTWRSYLEMQPAMAAVMELLL